MSHNLILNNLLFIFIFPQLIDRLHKYGFCLSKTTKYTIQEEIGHHFLDRAVELLKQGRKFVLVLDNIDWDVRVHEMRSDHQNKSVHAVTTSIVFVMMSVRCGDSNLFIVWLTIYWYGSKSISAGN